MITFGLTGGIACGKSTINKIFTANNIPMVDADIVARHVVEPGSEGLYTLAQAFGAQYICADGSLNRPKLGALVFDDPTVLAKLNSIMFPMIFEESEKQIEVLHNNGNDIVGYDSALIIEMGLSNGFTPLIVVHCSVEDQINRIIKRNKLTREEAVSRINTQMPAAEKIKFAAFVIDTSNSKEESAQQAIFIINKLKELNNLT
jgi:dephospho-CoA kinase